MKKSRVIEEMIEKYYKDNDMEDPDKDHERNKESKSSNHEEGKESDLGRLTKMQEHIQKEMNYEHKAFDAMVDAA
jgi:hypothetical protein